MQKLPACQHVGGAGGRPGANGVQRRGGNRAGDPSGPTPPVAAEEALDQERMARLSYPRQQSGPGAIVAPWNRVRRGVVWATYIPPVCGDPPHETETRVGLQQRRSTASAGSVKACVFILL